MNHIPVVVGACARVDCRLVASMQDIYKAAIGYTIIIQQHVIYPLSVDHCVPFERV